MTNKEIVDNVHAQPVGRATLVLNEKCPDPTKYLENWNNTGFDRPEMVKTRATGALRCEDKNP